MRYPSIFCLLLAIHIHLSSAVDRLLSTISPSYSSHLGHAAPYCNQPQYTESPSIATAAWCAANNAHGAWLQVDLGDQYTIDSVSTWSRDSTGQWVTAYNLQYSTDGSTFISLGTFQGNLAVNNEQRNYLSPTINARYLRFTPLASFNWPAMRIEVSGSSSQG